MSTEDEDDQLIQSLSEQAEANDVRIKELEDENKELEFENRSLRAQLEEEGWVEGEDDKDD
ncbi:hypothetical protein TrLO_g8370, partial [Triparma laevis f. longispina]